MNKEEYAKYQKLLVKGEVLAPTKMVHFMNEGGTKQFTAAIAGDARVLYKLYEWSRNGIKANSVEDLGHLLNKALHETVGKNGREIEGVHKYLVSDWESVYSVKLEKDKAPNIKKRENKYLHFTGDGDGKHMAKKLLKPWVKNRLILSRDDAGNIINNMYGQVSKLTRSVSASHMTYMHPKEVLEPFTNNLPAPRLHRRHYEEDGEREMLQKMTEHLKKQDRNIDDAVDESIAWGFWKKFGKRWRESEELRKEVEKWPKLKKHLEEVHAARAPFRNSPIGPIMEQERPRGRWRQIEGQWIKTDSEMLETPSSKRNHSPRGNLPPKPPPSRPIPRSSNRGRKNSG